MIDTESVNSLFTNYNSSLGSPKSLKFDIPDTYPNYIKSLQTRSLHSYNSFSSASSVGSLSPNKSSTPSSPNPSNYRPSSISPHNSANFQPGRSSIHSQSMININNGSNNSTCSSSESEPGIMSYSYYYSSSSSTLTPISSPHLKAPIPAPIAKSNDKRDTTKASLPSPNATPKGSPKPGQKVSSFASVHSASDTSILKIKIYRDGSVVAIKLRKDKLINLQDLVKVIKSKIDLFDKLYLCFSNKSLSPMPMTDFLQDIIMDYIAVKDKIYIRAT